MAEPNNEEAICGEVVRYFATRLGSAASITGHPDREERQEEAVELLFDVDQTSFALEHTRVESFPEQIADGRRFGDFLGPLEQAFGDILPGRYRLVVPVGLSLRVPVREQEVVRLQIAEWILKQSVALAAGSGDGVNHVTEVLPGLKFGVTLARVSDGPKALLVYRTSPDDLEEKREARVRTALERKCGKLAKHKGAGRQTVLALESNDIALGNWSVIAQAVAKALAARDDAPDHILLIETEGRPWYLWPLKEGVAVYLDPRLLSRGFVKLQ